MPEVPELSPTLLPIRRGQFGEFLRKGLLVLLARKSNERLGHGITTPLGSLEDGPEDLRGTLTGRSTHKEVVEVPTGTTNEGKMILGTAVYVSEAFWELRKLLTKPLGHRPTEDVLDPAHQLRLISCLAEDIEEAAVAAKGEVPEGRVSITQHIMKAAQGRQGHMEPWHRRSVPLPQSPHSSNL
jgi:hypothetical protein